MEGLEPKHPPLALQKNDFFTTHQKVLKFRIFQKSRFFRGQRGVVELRTLHKVLKYMGVNGFIIFWTQKGQFQGEHRGGFQSPPPNRIFLTPRQIGLTVTCGV